MKKEIKEKWIAALTGGKYKQGIGQLKTAEDKYCCLGVLCDISGLGKWVGDGPTRKYQVSESDWSTSVLPRAVMQWAGLSNENPSSHSSEGKDSFAALNDNGTTFEQLAAIIAEKL